MKKLNFKKETLAISLVLSLSAILSFSNLGIEGYANSYYSAGVRSMLTNFKNFFFVALDPSGFVSIDKPPVGFWIQALFAKLLGFSGFSVILPQAIAAVISVWLLYHLVNRTFGNLAGIVAALCLSLTPIFVAASRNNTIDNLLVLCLLLACYPLFIAAEKGKPKYLILSLVILGIGFNIKMVEAYLIAPAIYITYFLSPSLTYKSKIKHLTLGSIVLLLVSLSWAITVDLIPSKDRPFVGSSADNSVTQLIIGHNGLERIGIKERQGSGSEALRQNTKEVTDTSKNQYQLWKQNSLYTNDFERRNTLPNTRAGSTNSSKPGITRLFHYDNLSDQISWLLPFALISFIAASLKEKLRYPLDTPSKLSLVFWFLWLLTEFLYFSFSPNVTHSYYLTTMAPPLASLCGIGLTAMLDFYKKDTLKKLLLPTTFLVNGVVEILLLYPNYRKSDGYKFTILETAILSLGASIILIVISLEKNTSSNPKHTKLLVSMALIGTLTAPLVWSFTTLFYPMNGSSPYAGLELVTNRQKEDFNPRSTKKLVNFLASNKRKEEYLVAVPSANTYGSDLILSTGEPILTIGGYSGADKIINLNQFKQLVTSGKLRYALVNNGSSIENSRLSNSNNDIMNWIKETGTLVPDDRWKNGSTTDLSESPKETNTNDRRNSEELYDLKLAMK